MHMTNIINNISGPAWKSAKISHPW